MPHQRKYHSDTLLDTLEAFAETHPDFEGVHLDFQDRATGEDETVRMMQVDLNGEPYLVVVKKVGGARG